MKIKAWAGYLCMIAVSVLFILFLNGQGGSYLLGVLLAAPVISISLTLYLKKKITITLHSGDTILNKGDKTFIDVYFEKKGFLPTPFLNIIITAGSQFKTEDLLKYRLTLGFQRKEQFRCEFKAVFWGTASAGIQSVSITDFLGLVSFPIINEEQQFLYSKEFKIYPDIYDISEKNELLQSVQEMSAFNDGEETIQLNSFSAGVPGYEHREYIPGDSLKKINWKLSAKKDYMMVRLDEQFANAEQTVILDWQSYIERRIEGDINKHQQISLYYNELVLEASLSFLNALLIREVPCRFLYYMKNEWQYALLNSPAEIESLRFKMADLNFPASGNDERIPAEILIKGEIAVTLFSAGIDQKLISQISDAKSKGLSIQTVTSVTANNTWQIVKHDGSIDFVHF